MPRNGSGVFSRLAGTTAVSGATIASAPYNNVIDDLVADANTPRPIVAGGTAATTAAAALVNLGLTATAAEINVLDGVTASTAELNLLDGVTATTAQINATAQLSGRNRIINGQGRVNQRGYVSGTATTGANQYTLDRWRVVVSGQSLTFTGNAAGRTMTAPAGGVEQVIENVNIEGGTYTINWTGTATCTVDGVARAKGETFTLTANTAATVRFTGGTFSDVQLELGSVVTPFERMPFGDELVRCQRYFEFTQFILASATLGGGAAVNSARWKVQKAVTPALVLIPASGTGASLTALDLFGFHQTGLHSAVVSATVSGDSEL